MRLPILLLAIVGSLTWGCGEAPPAEEPAPNTDQVAETKGGKAKRGKGRKGAKAGGSRAKGGKAPVVSQGASTDQAAVTFVVNCHDWYYHEESARSVNRLIDILTKHGVKGEFYFTAPLFQTYLDHHPETLQRLKDTDMVVSYHLRAPHPVARRSEVAAKLGKMTREEALAELMLYETRRMDMSTGKVDASAPGGYQLLVDYLGYPPPSLGLNAITPEMRDLELEVLKELGARMFVRKHSGDSLAMTTQGLLARPSEWAVEKVDGAFWFDQNRAFEPASVMGGKSGYGVVLVHENDFHADFPGWQQVYGGRDERRRAPFDLQATDPDFERFSQEHIDQNWANWEAFVAYGAQHLRVVTSKDIIADYEASH
jgi:peptidoglycan/xylan/chitin deacetylase (PgdA/CDA1 family)